MRRQYIVAIYIRISVDDKASRSGICDESNSISNQRDLLYAYINKNAEFSGCQIIELCDDGYSGTNMNRPAMQRLVAMARASEIDCVVVKDFSRFGRDYLTVSDYIDQIFPFLGIRFISVNSGYDSLLQNGKTSGVDVAFYNVISSYYSKDLSVKVKSALRVKAKNGEFLSSFPPIGYLKSTIKRNSLIIDKDSAPTVRRIFELAGAEMSVLQIAKLLNAEKVPTPSLLRQQQGQYQKRWQGALGDVSKQWHDSSITRILRDEQYLGKVIYGKRPCKNVAGRQETAPKPEWIVVENRHEPLVTEKIFNKAQENLRKWETRVAVRGITQLFTGKLFCGHCGYRLIRVASPTPRFMCHTRLVLKNANCPTKRIKEAELASTVLQATKAFIAVVLEENDLLKKAHNNDYRANLHKQLTAYQNAQKAFTEQKAELYETLLNKHISRDEYIYKSNGLSLQWQELHRQLTAIEKELAEIDCKLNTAKQNGTELEEYLKTAALTREMVACFVNKIYAYSNQAIHIEWAFEKPLFF